MIIMTKNTVVDYIMNTIKELKEDIREDVGKIDKKIDTINGKIEHVLVSQQQTKNTLEFHSKLIDKHDVKIEENKKCLNELNLKIEKKGIDGVGDVLKWFISLPKKQMFWTTIILLFAATLLLTVVTIVIILIYQGAPGLIEGLLKWIM